MRFGGPLGLFFFFIGVFWAPLEASKVHLGASWGLQGVLEGLLGHLLGLFGVILSSQTDPPSFFGALSGLQEALGGGFGTSSGSLRCDFEV